MGKIKPTGATALAVVSLAMDTKGKRREAHAQDVGAESIDKVVGDSRRSEVGSSSAVTTDRNNDYESSSEMELEGVCCTDSDDEGRVADPQLSLAGSPMMDTTADLEPRRKKNKKIKKKKKSTKGAGELDFFAALEAKMLPPEVADKRYSSTLESMRSDNSFLWLQLNRCRITDKKARKLFAAMKENLSLTSLDLSENLLTDGSLQSLMHVLNAGSAPNLIHVDVRANPISFRSQDLVCQLQSLRRHLKVDFHFQLSQQNVCEDMFTGGDTDVHWTKAFPASNWVPSFTDTGGSTSQTENFMGSILPRLSSPEALQEKVELALLSIRRNSSSLHVSALACSLRDVIINFSQQLYHSEGNTEWATLDELPKGLPLLLEELRVFLNVLNLSPPPVLCQRRLEEQTAGLHRIALVEMLNLLLVPESRCIEDKLVAEGTAARLVSVFLQFPWNNILHGSIFRFLLAILSKSRIRSSVLEGSTGLVPVLSRVGEECAALPIGKRPGYSGYILRLSKEVQALAKKEADVKNFLIQNEQWRAYEGPDGALRKMLAEQSGNLGGPRPTISQSVTPVSKSQNDRTPSTKDQHCQLLVG